MNNIAVELDQGICTLTLDRPDKKNAITPFMYADLAREIENAQKDESCLVIVIAANGNDFTAGNDLSAFADQKEGNLTPTVNFMQALMHCKLPVVAAVKGNAVGIGTTLLLHCDFVVACENAKFMTPFINLGLVPEYASSYLLPKCAGYLNATKWLMLGTPFDAKSALQQGVVSYVVENHELEQKVSDIARQLTNKPRAALMQTKALLRQDSRVVQEVIDEELILFAQALQSEAAKEAFDAFLNKRPIDNSRFLG